MQKLTLLVLAIVLSACSLPGSKSEFDTNLEKWQASNIKHYRYSLAVMCFCPGTDKMPLSIEVRDGEIVSMNYADGTPVTAQDVQSEFFSGFATIDRLFSELKADLGGAADEVAVKYHPTYGFPTEISIDRIKAAVDDELSLTVTEFEVLD